MLTTKQARENQEKYGFNELVEGKKTCHLHDLPLAAHYGCFGNR